MDAIEKRAHEIRDRFCPPGDYDYSDILDAIVAALTTQWQPIESAPKDGTRLMLWDSRAGGYAVTGAWVAGSADDHETITHWQPLPPGPEVP